MEHSSVSEHISRSSRYPSVASIVGVVEIKDTGIVTSIIIGVITVVFAFDGGSRAGLWAEVAEGLRDIGLVDLGLHH